MKRVLAEEGRELWDGKVQEVKVTDISDRTVTLRILVSAIPISRTEMRPSNSHPRVFLYPRSSIQNIYRVTVGHKRNVVFSHRCHDVGSLSASRKPRRTLST